MKDMERPAPRDCDNCYLACEGRADELFFPAKSLIFEAEDPATRIFLLLSGLVQISASEGGGRAVLTLIRPGQVFGWSGFFLDEDYGVRAQAFQDSYACALGTELVRGLLSARPTLALSMLGMFCRTVRQGARLAAIRSHPSVLQRLDSLLELLGQDTASRTPEGEQIVDFTHEELADMIGSTRPTVTRQLHLLRRQGLVALQKKRVILTERGGNG